MGYANNASTPLRVAIYGRVSTEHEAQLSAFENQKEWYHHIVQQHPNWAVVNEYFDKGITGTQAKKRPAFSQMIIDAHNKRFDLIVTREVCRFARNTVDALIVTRDLARINVEVYFVNDNIWTMDGDGELRLTIMATLAQEESRKVSERVMAGQAISRSKGVLYGNGNILGYDRIDGTYVINPEQACTVRKIFDLYADGWGYKRICSELTRLGYKNTQGIVDWKQERIGRILRNATYKGFIGYNKSHSDGYLTQKRINHHDDEYVYVKGNFPAIIPEDLWDKCESIRHRRSTHLRDSTGALRKFGKRESASIWTSKLRCSCGSSFRRFLWRKNENGVHAYGYECYRKKRSVSASYLKTHGLDASAACQCKSIPDWHIDLMSTRVFQSVWKDNKSAVLLACQMIEECATQDAASSVNVESILHEQMAQLEKKLEGLRSMCALGDISREEFLADKQKIQEEISCLQEQLQALENHSSEPPLKLDMSKIRSTLETWVDFSGPTIAEALVDQFVLQVVVIEDNVFNWTLDLTGSPLTSEERPLSPSEIAFHLYHQKQSSASEHNPESTSVGTVLSPHITNPQELFRFTITEADAAAYCKSIGMKFFGKKWQDKTVIVSI